MFEYPCQYFYFIFFLIFLAELPQIVRVGASDTQVAHPTQGRVVGGEVRLRHGHDGPQTQVSPAPPIIDWFGSFDWSYGSLRFCHLCTWVLKSLVMFIFIPFIFIIVLLVPGSVTVIYVVWFTNSHIIDIFVYVYIDWFQGSVRARPTATHTKTNV